MNKSKSSNPQEKQLERESRLLSEISQLLTKTGLVSNINIYPGNLKDSERNPYIEFRFKDSVPEQQIQAYAKKRCELKNRIAKRIKQNWAEVSDVETYQAHQGVYREYLRINPEAKFDKYAEEQIRKGVLEIIVDELRNSRFQK